MLRPDYERFNAVAPGELPAGWEILNMHNDKAWLQPLEHLITGRAVRRSKEELEEFYGFPYVAGIDIFPYDYSAPTKEEDEYVRDMERVLLNVAQCYKNDEYTAEAKEALLVQVEQLCRVHVDRSGDVPNQLYKLFEKLVTMYGEDETPYIAYLPKHANIKKECYSETILMDFEYIKVPMPIGYEEILGYKYGKEWRTPRLVRSSHDYPYYQKQHEFDLKQRGLI
jgi:lipopolysaccharide cholinephosphotransferase